MLSTECFNFRHTWPEQKQEFIDAVPTVIYLCQGTMGTVYSMVVSALSKVVSDNRMNTITNNYLA